MEIIIQSWADLKSVIAAKSLSIQYYDQGNNYLVWAVDSSVTYFYTIWKLGFEPLDSDPTQITADRTDFETNYQPIANAPVYTSQASVVQTVNPYFANRVWIFSHLFNDKTTWWGDSIHVTNETLGTGDGTTTTFNFANQYVIDLCHGKVTQEDFIVPSSGDYLAHITVGGTPMTEQAFAETGGDYTIDYAAGTITFTVAPTSGAAVVATSYYYSPANSGSTFYVKPPSGGKILISSAEATFSADMNMTDALISAFFCYIPEEGAPPAKFEYTPARVTFKRVWDFINLTNGAWPTIAPFAGSRGYTQTINQLTFDYNVPMQIDDAIGGEIRIWLENHTPYTGECAQLTFYGYIP